MNRDALFLILCSCLTALFVYFFGKAKEHFNDTQFLNMELVETQKKLERKNLELELASQRLFDFEQSVLASISDSKFKKDQILKTQIRAPASVPKSIDFSSAILNEGKKLFREKDFDLAKNKFREFEQKYPYSIHLPEVLFLKAETFFLTSEFENCLEVVDLMIQHYPENEFTGALMIRMAQIFEFRKRNDEAAQVYRTILSKFRTGNLRQQALSSLRELEKRH